jgi:hypothetical protein
VLGKQSTHLILTRFQPGDRRFPFILEPFQRFRIRGQRCQYYLRKRVGSWFAKYRQGLTHPLTQVVLTNQDERLITRLKPGENEMNNFQRDIIDNSSQK